MSTSSVSATTPSGSSAPARPPGAAAPITIRSKKWMPIGYWRFPSNVNEDCPICQESLTLRCLECQANDSDKCGLAFGECSHCYHLCCSRWSKDETKMKCPIDFTDWVVVKIEYPFSNAPVEE